jgi:hypothetical protein
MPIELITGIEPANDGTFKMVKGKDVDLTETAELTTGNLTNADSILIDEAHAGTQASTKHALLSSLWAYILGKINGTTLSADTSGNAATVTTNANLTGHITSTGNASVLGSFTVAQLSTALSDATISGNNSGDQTVAYASAISPGNSGLVPAAGSSGEFLAHDGDWATPPDTNTTYSEATESAEGLMSIAHHDKLDGIDDNANAYTLPEATATDKGGIELFSNTDQSVAATAVSTMASRTYGLQLNSDGQGVVNVPWVDTDTNTTYSAFDNDNAGLVPDPGSTGTTTKYLREDGSFQVPPDTDTVYTHPTDLAGDNISVDTGALTGATVISDLDFNVTTNTAGHVTDANGTVSTRTLTLANLGYTGHAAATNNTGTVTSVGTAGEVNGVTLTGTVTETGNLTLGGTLAINNSDWSGTALAVANGGTGATTLGADAVLIGNGTSAITSSTNLTFDDTDLTIAATGKMEFRDGNSYINSPTANDLEIVATDIVLDAATSIELEANTAITGTLEVSGLIDPEVGHVYRKMTSTHYQAQGDIVNIGSGSTTRGALHYYAADGSWALTDADVVATSGGVLLAIALGTDPDADGMLLRGSFTLDHDPGTLADVLYVSTEPGLITSTSPSVSGDTVRVVGYCLDSTNGQIWFNPDNTWVEIA